MEGEENGNTGEVPEPTIGATVEELATARARIADLEAAIAKDADLLAVGRTAARAATINTLLGTAKIAADTQEAFDIVADATAASLGIDLSRPLTAEQKTKFLAAAFPKLRGLIVGIKAATGVETSNPQPRIRRGL